MSKIKNDAVTHDAPKMRYFEVNLSSCDDENVPEYVGCTVICCTETPSIERVLEFLEEIESSLDIDFDEVSSIEEIPYEDVDCYIDNPADVPELILDESDTPAILETISISELAYMLYKQDWIDTHTSRADRLASIRSYFHCMNDCAADGFEPESYDGYLEENGFDDFVYACFDEFLDAEYLDQKYMIELLGNDSILVKLYYYDLIKRCVDIERHNNAEDEENDDSEVVSPEEDEDGVKQHIFDTIENALALAGYDVLDGDRTSVIIRHAASDRDFEIKVEETAV